MIKKIITAIYSAFISIVLISIILAGWTGYTFVSQSSKSNEIIKVIQNMYSNQKSVFVDVIELSKILVKDSGESISSENNDLLVEREMITDSVDDIKLDESPIAEDNGENPLGIVIEPSLPEVRENKLPDLKQEPLVFEQNELSMDEMETAMDMN